MQHRAGPTSWTSYDYPNATGDLGDGTAMMVYDADSATYPKNKPGASAQAGNIGWYRNYTTEFFGDYDLLLSPSLAVPAFKIGEQPEEIGGKRVPHRLWGFTPFTYLFNLTGNPAASVPAGFSSAGLPIGLQIIGDMKDEVTVLAASAALEEARPWADKRPPVS